MKKSIKKKLQVTTMASALVVSLFAVPMSVFADDSLILQEPYSSNSLSDETLISPYMGNERVVVTRSLSVRDSYKFGDFTLKNSVLKIAWRPTIGESDFRLQVLKQSFLGDSVIATISFGPYSTDEYITGLPTGDKLTLRVIGKANGDIYGYDWGAN